MPSAVSDDDENHPRRRGDDEIITLETDYNQQAYTTKAQKSSRDWIDANILASKIDLKHILWYKVNGYLYIVSGLDLWVNGMHILDKAVERTVEYIEKMPKSIRKAYGQFFTSKETAVFMASLFLIPKNNSELSILDPGAGSGMLSIALIDRIQDYPFTLVKVVCYENDPSILDLLKSNLEYAAQHSRIRIEYKIIEENNILSQELDYNGMLGANPNPPKYDIVIGNPPYKKYQKMR